MLQKRWEKLERREARFLFSLGNHSKQMSYEDDPFVDP